MKVYDDYHSSLSQWGQPAKSVRVWLVTCLMLVVTIVMVGGITRLTNSGLSMVDWNPIMGSIPPLSSSDWDRVFKAYQQSPEFLKINFRMTVSEFKFIFFWEYIHRMIGRLIGVVAVFPFLYFWFKKRLSRLFFQRWLMVIVLIGCQGVMGWFMVQSGLVNNPHVSHFRLAAHLCLAFLIFSLIFKEIIRIKYPCRSDTSWAIRLVLVALSFQIVFGAFTAGLDAGTYYGTYPKMGSDWFPQAAFMFDGLFNNALNNPIMIQWIHRWAAVVVVIGVVGLFFLFRNSRPLKPVAAVGVILVAAQFGLGVATILTSVWLPVALLHQLGALILLAVLVLLGHRQSYAAIADKTGTDPALSCTEN